MFRKVLIFSALIFSLSIQSFAEINEAQKKIIRSQVILIHEGMVSQDIVFNQLIKLVCENPVKIFGIKNKGYIKKGFDADLTIVDMNKKHTIKNQEIESKCKWSPFNEYEFKGKPVITIVNGKIKMKNGEIIGDAEGLPLIF